MVDMSITVFLVALMIITHLIFPLFMEDSCTAVKNFHPKQWLFSIFPHENKENFIYQIISFIWKGVLLEGSIGSRKFASMVIKLFLITMEMIVMVVRGWLLWDAGHRYRLCHGFIWRVSFGMYGFLLPTYKNWTKLVIASIFTVELAVVYFLYPVLLLAGPACGTLSGLLCSYVPQLLINCWNKVRNIVAYPTPSIEAQGSSTIDERVWRCQSCSSLNGVYFDCCEYCEVSRQGGLQSSLTRTMSTLELVQFTETQNSDTTDLVWNCVHCSFKNGVYLDACESCGTLRWYLI